MSSDVPRRSPAGLREVTGFRCFPVRVTGAARGPRAGLARVRRVPSAPSNTKATGFAFHSSYGTSSTWSSEAGYPWLSSGVTTMDASARTRPKERIDLALGAK
jgi:hypothetical protein